MLTVAADAGVSEISQGDFGIIEGKEEREGRVFFFGADELGGGIGYFGIAVDEPDGGTLPAGKHPVIDGKEEFS